MERWRERERLDEKVPEDELSPEDFNHQSSL